MPSRAFLRATSHAKPTPNREARAVASMKYDVPIGWMFLFADAERIAYTRPDDPERKLFFFRAAVPDALGRLGRAARALADHPYFGPRFGSLAALAAALESAGKEFVELDLEEILAMGEPGDEFEQQIHAAPTRLQEAAAAVSAKDDAKALELLNSLREVSGLELSGSAEGDEEAWKRELQFHKVASPDEYCRLRVAGEFA